MPEVVGSDHISEEHTPSQSLKRQFLGQYLKTYSNIPRYPILENMKRVLDLFSMDGTNNQGSILFVEGTMRISAWVSERMEALGICEGKSV